jgi:hypothetical protein
VGDDDANDGQGECPGHVFDLVNVRITLAGAEREYECRSCGALSVKTRGQ